MKAREIEAHEEKPMNAHACLLNARASLENADFWLHQARHYEFNDIDADHAAALAQHARTIADRIEELRRKAA